MNKVKKLILSATIFILTICSTSVVFGANQVSWNDFCNWVNENLEINISSYTTCGMSQETWQQFKDKFINSNGFYIYENNDTQIKNGTMYEACTGTIYFVLNTDEIPIQTIKVEDHKYKFYSPDSNRIYDQKIYVFNKDTKQYVKAAYITYKNTEWFKWVMDNNDSVANFYSEENSKYVLHNQILCASNFTFIVQNLQNNYNWEYELTVEEMTTTPFPWGEIGTGGGDNIIYDYTDESYEYFKKTYFRPYLEFKAPVNGYVDYTGNWDKGTTWGIGDTTYKDNEFYLYIYSGDGSVDGNLYAGHIYLDVFKANYLTSGDINYTYYDTRRCSPGQVFIDGEDISENVVKFRFTLKRCFNDEGEIDHDFNTGWLNDLSGDPDYIFRLRFEDAFFETTSKTSWFYFNLQSPLNLYRNTEQYNIPKEYTSELPFGYGGPSYNSDGSFSFGGGGFRDENGNQIIETSDFSSILNSAKSFLSNFLGFFDIFPPWFNTLIALALTVAIVCRVIGR